LLQRVTGGFLRQRKYVRHEDLPLVKENGQVLEVGSISDAYQAQGKKPIQRNIRDISDRKHRDGLKEGIIRTAAHESRRPLAIVKEGISVVLRESPEV